MREGECECLLLGEGFIKKEESCEYVKIEFVYYKFFNIIFHNLGIK